MLLRPVEGAVGEPDQLVPPAALHREGRQPGADRHGADVIEVDCRDPFNDRVRSSEGHTLVVVDEQERELVAAEPEGFPALTQSRTDL